MDTEWHFFATSHVKGTYDGIMETIKRLPRKVNTPNPYDEHIMTPKQLYEWVAVNIPSVTTEYCAAEDHSKEIMKFKRRFWKAQILPGT
jgi:hypothetical protein